MSSSSNTNQSNTQAATTTTNVPLVTATSVVPVIESKGVHIVPSILTASPITTLVGKVAIITGASRGIGRGIALSLSRDGAKVVINYQKDKKSADDVVTAITNNGGIAISIQADVTSSSQVDNMFNEVKRHFGRIDIIVANSGVGTLPISIATTTNDQFDRLIDVNLKGVFYTLRAAANHVENNGRIIVIGSNSKTGTFYGYGAYACAKSAVEILATTLAHELGSRAITVNTVHPGVTNTDFMTGASSELAAQLASLSPMNRLGTINDLGDAVALLASEHSRWISGQSIMVSGAMKA